MSAGGTSGGQGVATSLGPAAAALPSHAAAAAASNPLLAAAREQERVYMELLSRPPYNSDPVLAQQVAPSNVTVIIGVWLVHPVIPDACVSEFVLCILAVSHAHTVCIFNWTLRLLPSESPCKGSFLPSRVKNN